MQQRSSTAVDNRDSLETLRESIERKGRSTAVDGHKSQETSSESIELNRPGRAEDYRESLEEGVENTTQSKFGYECHEGEPQRSDFRLAIFSGPHGTGISVGDYGKVLMIAVGFGIAAQLRYLKELVRGFNNYQVRTREIRLVWQLQSFGKYPGSDRR